jgi:N-methylhydantoinase B
MSQGDLHPNMDPVTFEVIRNAFLNVTEEMALTVRRAAYSTNIKTRADFSCAIFDNQLRCVAQSFSQPPHLVCLATIAPVALREFGLERLEPGDALIVNDPHRGSSHLNDVNLISPVVRDGRRIGFVANMAHHVDVGGSSPASLGVNRELCQEGLILPPTRIARGGVIDENVLNLILANIRAPRETAGDIRAQMSANFIGCQRILELADRFSEDTLIAFCDELIAYTERWTDREIRQLPEGVYEATGFRDDDGFTDEPVRFNLKLEIKDGHVTLDPTGSSPQRAAPMNCTRNMATTVPAFIVKCLIDDRVPVNHGFLNRVHTVGEDGLICTAGRPAAVVGGWETVFRMTELVWLALHPALPDRVPAASKGIIVNIGFGGNDPRIGEYFCYMETIGGGNGARPTKDGPDAVQTTIHNTENAPVEEVELNYPIRLKRYELIEDSSGAGRYRGGCGIRRDFEFPYSDVTFTALSDGRKFPPWGLAGGHDARPARFILDPEGENRDLPSKYTVEVPKGGCVRVETPGGGGFGDPRQRDPEAVARDLRDGKISENRKREVYGS